MERSKALRKLRRKFLNILTFAPVLFGISEPGIWGPFVLQTPNEESGAWNAPYLAAKSFICICRSRQKVQGFLADLSDFSFIFCPLI
jgi:hypothetical protein